MNSGRKVYLVTGANTIQLLGKLLDFKVTVSKEATEMYSIQVPTTCGSITGIVTLTDEGREMVEEMNSRYNDAPPELKMQVQEADPPKKISYQQQQRNLPKFLRRGRR